LERNAEPVSPAPPVQEGRLEEGKILIRECTMRDIDFQIRGCSLSRNPDGDPHSGKTNNQIEPFPVKEEKNVKRV
jgi:hypothetical protein